MGTLEINEECFIVNELPKNPSGKIQKFNLREDEAAVDPEAETVST